MIKVYIIVAEILVHSIKARIDNMLVIAEDAASALSIAQAELKRWDIISVSLVTRERETGSFLDGDK